ncbi:MAG: ABC transporter ATP-binding protein, partial [Bacteroidota bacterium]
KKFGLTILQKRTFSSMKTNIKDASLKIEVTQLSTRYQNRNVLRNVSVSFLPGLHYLIGANGSGKTTLLHILSGLQPYTGNVMIGELELKALNHKQLAQKLALVPQKLQLPFRVKVKDYILMGRFPYLNWLGEYKATDHDKAGQVMSDLGLTGFAERDIQQLSGGELQKVLLARGLCQDTPVLILDEPAQSLDPWQQTWLYEQLDSLSQNRTIICATHDPEALQNKRAQVSAIRKGELLFQSRGPINKDDLLEVYKP